MSAENKRLTRSSSNSNQTQNENNSIAPLMTRRSALITPKSTTTTASTAKIKNDNLDNSTSGIESTIATPSIVNLNKRDTIKTRSKRNAELEQQTPSTSSNPSNSTSTSMTSTSVTSSSIRNLNESKSSDSLINNDYDQTLNDSTKLGKRRTPSHLRLPKTDINKAINPTPTSNIVTRKRQMSFSSDLTNKATQINDNPLSIENEDSNSSSACLYSTSLSGSLSSSFFNSNKRLKQKYKEIESLIDQNANDASSLDQKDAKENEKQVLLNCPIQGCDSLGHLDGLTERHCSFDTCPKYFDLSKDECVKRRAEIQAMYAELDKKIVRMNENRKNLRHKISTEEQSKYYDKVQAQLKDLVKIKENLNTNTALAEALMNPELLGDLKNLSTSFLINSITTGITPLTPNPLTTSYLNKHNHVNSLNGLNGLSSNLQMPPINDLKVSKFELELFKDALVMSSSPKIVSISEEDNVKLNTLLPLFNKTNKLIQFGNFEIETWYKSPYPEDYWQLDKIYICQYCLKYMKSHSVLNRHLEKCLWRHPPGREIYRKDNVSFFEVDGKFNKIYCQNLCLLAKLFLDHKTLYFDVEPFLFYVLTKYDESNGAFQMVGYFSKEKQSVMNFNLSCILILPPFMNKGYGTLLIDFSYLLSKVEEKIGSPERPLSDLGLISYRNYWKTKLLSHLSERLNESEISIKDTSMETGILSNDIISTFQYIGLIKYWKGKHLILKDKELIDKYRNKSTHYEIDSSCLKWTPYVYQTIINESEIPSIPSGYGNKLNKPHSVI